MARSCLTRVLALFAERFPAFTFPLTCDQGERPSEGLSEHRFDVVLVSHLATERRGQALRGLSLAWIGRSDVDLPLADPVPLVLVLAPDGKREAALRATRVCPGG